MKRSIPLSFETLEARETPAVFGNPWPDASHLTLSFAPDGTAYGDQGNVLRSLLDARSSTAGWQIAALRAFQTYAVYANINIGLVADGGQPFGSSGPIQGDQRFGDIRLGASSLGKDVVAVAQPFDPVAGNWSGDVRLNKDAVFGSNGYDLFSVLLHEAGHVFGLPGSTNPASAMYSIYTGVRTGLSGEDITALRALYGTRNPDTFDANSPNDSLSNATRLRLADSGGRALGGVVTGDITTLRDVDYYRFSLEGVTGPTDVTLRLVTSGLSALVGRLSVLDARGRVLTTATATSPLSGDLTLSLSGLTPLTNYYVRVESASGDVFGIGSYQVQVRPNGVPYPTEPRFNDEDSGINDTLAVATDLRRAAFLGDARFDVYAEESLSSATDVDFFRLRTPQVPPSQATVMTVMAWAQDLGGPAVRISVLDKLGQEVPAEVLVNQDNNLTIQIRNIVQNADYYLSIRAARPGPNALGNYALGVDYRTTGVQLENFTTGTMTEGQKEAGRTLVVGESTLFHFVASLGDRQLGTNPDVAMRMTIYDAAGNVVFTQFVADDDAVSSNIFLPAGTYTFRFAAGSRSGKPIPKLSFSLKGEGISDPIGPQPANTSGALFGSGSTVGAPPSGYSWILFGNYPLGGPTDPYSNPWWL